MKKILLYFIVGTLCLGCSMFSAGKKNVSIPDSSEVYVYLPTNANMLTLLESVHKSNVIVDFSSFESMARAEKFDKYYRPGKYRLKDGMTNKDLFRLFKSGKREEVKVSFNYARTLSILAGKLNGKLEADSVSFMKLWTDTAQMKKLYGVSASEIPGIFVPNTYNFYWNTDAKEFTDKMYKEYQKFWTEERKTKAAALGYTPAQVTTLASIVQSEQTKFSDEWPIIAKLYLNRLKKGMPLQADPTVIYAMGDFTITRVLEKYLTYDSPYNTYLHAGLPPGPIMITEAKCIDAVLNPDSNEFIYMCAKEDFSGRHNFTASYNEHLNNAARYQRALSKYERENRGN